MPEDPFEIFRRRLPAYLREVREAHTEAAKALAFLTLIRQTFGDIDADRAATLIPDLERHVRVLAGTVLVRGSIDALLGNLVIEFKRGLNEQNLRHAKEQLRTYVAALWAIDGQRTNYMLMATDGLSFKVYKPSAPFPAKQVSPDEISLEEVNLMAIETSNPEDAFRWLDRYVLWRDRIPPTTDDMSRDFGIQSPTFSAAIERLRKAWIAGREEGVAPFQEWSKYLSVVYGSTVGDETLFLKHTYLATLAKLMVYSYYSSGAIPSRDEVRKVLVGESFKEWGIENFLEEDFFSWLVRGEAEEEGLGLAWELLRVLERYDLSKLTEDVLKGLYQGLVDPAARHDLGEYYTPDWLAEWIVERILLDAKATALDPACGSGTFLAAAVRHKAKSLALQPHLLLVHIVASIKGIDVHPLAVLISKANYLMALGNLVQFKAGRIHVPVYLANSLDFPIAKRDVEHGVEVYRYPVSRTASLVLPKDAVTRDLVAEVVEAVAKFAHLIADGTVRQDAPLFDQFAAKEVHDYPSLKEGAKDALWDTCKVLARLIKAHKDTIYAFIVKNIYRPATIGRFDVVMGNPPWLSYHYVRLPEYQVIMKRMIINEHKLLPSKKSELLTHMELATLFFARSVLYYSKEGGKIGFVMPRAVFNADQHDVFRRCAFEPEVSFEDVVDLEGVSPLFNVPACVVFARRDRGSGFPKTIIRMSGTLPEKNASLANVEALCARNEFSITSKPLTFAELGGRSAWSYGEVGPCGGRRLRAGPSPYMESFREGATIFPTGAWWVDIKSSPKLGVDPDEPLVETSQRATRMAKPTYATLRLQGNVERVYLYGSLLGSDILPFVHLPLRPVLLPAQPSGNRYVLLKREQILSRGHQGMSRWIQKVEKEWQQRRAEKADKMTIYQRLDRGKGITAQSPRIRYWVLYNRLGTYLSACIVDTSLDLIVRTNGQVVPLQGFVAESGTLGSQIDNEPEALYLEAVFNSRVVDGIIKPMQAKGLWGERGIRRNLLRSGFRSSTLATTHTRT